MATTTVTPSIPLTTITPTTQNISSTVAPAMTIPTATTASSQTQSQQSNANNNGAVAPSQPSTAASQPSASSTTQVTTTATSRPSASSSTASASSNTRKPWFAESLTFANGLGTTALILTVIFGIGAWVGMKIQISQGDQNMDLTIWTVCADHEAIQNTSLCRSILAKDFSQFGKRLETVDENVYSSNLLPAETDLIVEKRDVEDEELPESETVTPVLSPLERTLAKLTPYDRALIDPKPDYSDLRYQPEPGIRVMVFPMVNLLVKPLSWIFDFVESMLLVLIYSIHRIFRWLTTAAIFCLQIWLYGIVESVFKTFLTVIDQAIFALMPSFMPAILVSDVASVLALTALRAYWYGTSYFGSLKWIVIFRLAIWLFAMAVIWIGLAINFMKSTPPRDVAGAIRARAPQWSAIRGVGSGTDFPTSALTANNLSYRIAAPVQAAEGSSPGPAVAAPPPPRRSPSQQPSSRYQPDNLDWFSSSSQEDGETAEESFYKSLSLVNRRRHGGIRT